MTKEEIKHDAYRRMTDIEDLFDDHVPRPVIAYYLLLTLIQMGSIDQFYQQHGWIEIDEQEAAEGKADYLGHGPLTLFEKDVIALLRDETRRRENARRPVVLPPARDIRLYG